MKTLKIFVLVVICSLGAGLANRASAQGKLANAIAQLALNIEKLSQFKGILSDLKKGYTILKGGYNTVKDITEGNFSVHKAFLDGLLEVSPTVKKYRKVAEIISLQISLIKTYKSAYTSFRSQGTFNAAEIDYLSTVYENLFDQSMQNLDELINVTTAGKLRMSDDERIAAIDRIYDEMAQKMEFLHEFNRGTAILSMSRFKEKKELESLKEINGVRLLP